MKQQLVSIALCTYNGSKHLYQQMDSLVNQNYANIQIVVVDDCSKDGTWDILIGFKDKYSFVDIYKNEVNLGYIKNFERAISLCKGDFICLSDQDDIWDKHKIEIMVSSFNKDSALIYHNSELIDEDGNLLPHSLSKRIGFTEGNNKHYNLLLNNCIAGHAIMFRKSLLNYIFPFQQNIPHDHWIAYTAAKIGSIQYLLQSLVKYRQHQKSVTTTTHFNNVISKKQRKQNIAEERIRNLNALRNCRNNSQKDIILIDKLVKSLSSLLSNHHFSISLFLLYLKNRKKLFGLYHKSFFSSVIMIFKERKIK